MTAQRKRRGRAPVTLARLLRWRIANAEAYLNMGRISECISTLREAGAMTLELRAALKKGKTR